MVSSGQSCKGLAGAGGRGRACPAIAVRIEAYRLGKEVPIAPRVRPMTVDEMPSAQPTLSRAMVMTKASTPSHATDMSSVAGYHSTKRGWFHGQRQKTSGTVRCIAALSGSTSQKSRYGTQQPGGGGRNHGSCSNSSSWPASTCANGAAGHQRQGKPRW